MTTPSGKFCGPCYRCKTDFWVPDALYEACKRSEKISFYCPYGHELHFPASDTEETKLRRERDRLLQRTAQLDDTIRAQKEELDRERAAVRALKDGSVRARKRSAAGTCPCCKRTFRQMAVHMKNQHPEFLATEVH